MKYLDLLFEYLYNIDMDKLKRRPGRPRLYLEPVDINVRLERKLLTLLRQQFPGETASRAVSLFVESNLEGRVVEASQDNDNSVP